MPKKDGDDFPKNVKDEIAKLCCLHCMKCGKPTSSSNEDGTKSRSTAMVCHISSSRKGTPTKPGPRYDANMGREERRSLSNAFFACYECGKLIDSDTSEFTVEMLNELKANSIREWREKSHAATPDGLNCDTRVKSVYRYSGQSDTFSNKSRADLVGEFHLTFILRVQSTTGYQQLLENFGIQVRANGSVLYKVDLKLPDLTASGDFAEKSIHVTIKQPHCTAIDEGDSIYLTFTVLGKATHYNVKVLEITEKERQKLTKYPDRYSQQHQQVLETMNHLRRGSVNPDWFK